VSYRCLCVLVVVVDLPQSVRMLTAYLTVSRNPSMILCLVASGARGGLFGAGGRFKGGTDPIMEKFNESISVDKRYVRITRTACCSRSHRKSSHVMLCHAML
jgi:hypothetical protein